MKKVSVKERLLETADRLFYQEGIRAVGIERVLAEADAAKASLYQHFGSKDALIAACVARRVEQSREIMLDAVKDAAPADRIVRLFEWLVTWVESMDFRGCAHQHTLTELADSNHPAVKVVLEQRKWIIYQLTEWLRDARVSDPEKLAGPFLVLVDGAMSAAEQDGPVRAREAAWAAEQLLRLHQTP